MPDSDERKDFQVEMDAAATQAAAELDTILGDAKSTAKDVLAFHKKWYLKAGHKRLGRLYIDKAKKHL
jgi:hypothetical protein